MSVDQKIRGPDARTVASVAGFSIAGALYAVNPYLGAAAGALIGYGADRILAVYK